jgi:hypothetical protein
MGVAARLVSLLACVVVLAGCGGDDASDSADGDARVDQRASADDGSTEPVEAGEGSLFADPGAIRPFSDPGSQIASDADLVDYLLPGLTGSGADCLEAGLDAERLLDADIADAAALVAAGILACVDPDEIGKIFGMYAVGFEDDGRSRYADLAACVIDAFAVLDPGAVEKGLVAVYTERLDLYGPPTSREVAGREIRRLTDCSTVAPNGPDKSDPGPPQNQRVVRWDLLRPGDCLVDLPPGSISQVTVVACGVPHRLEVVGSTFTGSADDADDQCTNLYRSYTGRDLGQSDHRLESLQGEPGSLSARLVCLATTADRRPTTGSIR